MLQAIPLAETTASSPMVALLALVLGSVVVISLILIKIRQSLLVGYFLCGLILANSGLAGMFGDNEAALRHAVGTLSELGIVLLMFTLGIEFSVRELIHLRRVVLLGGTIQVVVTTLVGMVLISLLGVHGGFLLVVAFALALSSTAVSMKTFQDMGIPNSPGARMTLGVSIYQDLATILFMVLLPSLIGSASGEQELSVVAMAILKGVVFLAVCLFLSRQAIPWLFHAVAMSRSRELFTILVVGLCALIAWGANWVGLSLALGSFTAGLVVSESIYSHRVLSEILPFKDLFLTIFFVSIGLMIDIHTVMSSWLPILAGVVAILSIKALIAFVIARWLGLRLRQSLVGAAALSSSGEFSLVLLGHAGALGGLDHTLEQMLLACTAITMGLVPTLMRWAAPLAGRLAGVKWLQGGKMDESLKISSELKAMQNHVIICGYGPVGQALHSAMEHAGIPSIILEMNPTTVSSLHHSGVRALFADATKIDTMKLAKADKARAVAFTFPEAGLAVQGVRAARYMNPEIVTFARAKFTSGVEELRNEGVNHILHDEETSGLAMVAAVMSCYGSSSQRTMD